MQRKKCYTMTSSDELLIGYDYDAWYGYGDRIPVVTDASTRTNSQTLIAGMSGSGKSYLTNQYFARICLQGGDDSVCYFSDFKQDDTFAYLRDCPRYYPYDRTIEALEIVYNILHKRQSGEDKLRTPVTLIWDEYMANILALLGTEKKKAEAVMHKVSEILMLGRSLAVRLIIACQRPDATAFPTGSRLNFGVIIVIGAAIESVYSMLMPKELIEKVGNRQFGTGEGVVLLQGSGLRFIKVPVIRNEDKLKAICIDALTRG
ncbi:hypothetical protein [Cellulosilyticum sp. I15G10I2]|uniref:hypothetical protein n=1 Tax=Cellulosilyticum sp. I15G10I2 TaxID=1892843 RepID=UPI000AC686F9|nr:hypothetical protein [Cellulosilyticum sp. I15G10I2]